MKKQKAIAAAAQIAVSGGGGAVGKSSKKENDDSVEAMSKLPSLGGGVSAATGGSYNDSKLSMPPIAGRNPSLGVSAAASYTNNTGATAISGKVKNKAAKTNTSKLYGFGKDEKIEAFETDLTVGVKPLKYQANVGGGHL